MSDDIPQAWHAALERRGIARSYRALGERAGMSHEAARRVVRGWSVKRSSVQKIADALGVDIEVVHDLRGEAEDRPTPWEPPAASSLLSHDEREALSRLISLMTAGRSEGGETRGDTAPIGGAVRRVRAKGLGRSAEQPTAARPPRPRGSAD